MDRYSEIVDHLEQAATENESHRLWNRFRLPFTALGNQLDRSGSRMIAGLEKMIGAGESLDELLGYVRQKWDAEEDPRNAVIGGTPPSVGILGDTFIPDPSFGTKVPRKRRGDYMELSEEGGWKFESGMPGKEWDALNKKYTEYLNELSAK